MLYSFDRRKNIRAIYFIVCCFLVIFISSFRSGPIYGKLDFILIDSRPWWPKWKPMVSSVLEKGNQPVHSDRITSTVFKSVFDQETVFFRRINYFSPMKVEEMNWENRLLNKLTPYGSLLLLLQEDSNLSDKSKKLKLGKFTENGLVEGWISLMKNYEGYRPYRCVVNLQGFNPSWVPWETSHWNPLLAHTGMFYSYNSEIGASMVSELQKNPPENCEVFY